MRGEQAYELRKSGLPWKEIAKRIGSKNATAAAAGARHYARFRGLTWPLDVLPVADTSRKGAGTLTTIECAHCGESARKRVGAVYRSRRNGSPIFCSRACSYAGRTTVKITPEERKEIKRLYDIERRKGPKRAEILAKKKASYYANHEEFKRKAALMRAERRADPEKYADYKAEMKRYRESPEWKQHKAKYDLERRAAEFGDMAEAYLVLLELDNEINELVPDRGDLYGMKGTRNKHQERKRAWQRTRRRNSTQ